MKKSRDFALGAVVLAAVQAASAQVTPYGVIDTSLRFQNNSNNSTASMTSLTPGAYGASRWGVRGREDLGGGLYTIYQLEHGFSPDTGTAADATRFFNRHAWVGVGGDWGRVTAGRQYSLVHEVLGMNMFDALGVGGYDETAWYVGSQYTLRNDNALKYRHAVSGVDVGAMYSVSEQPGVSASYGAMAMVPMGALTLGLAHHNDSAAVGERKTNLVAVKYKLGTGTTLQGHALLTRDLRAGADRKDRLYSMGAIHPLSDKITLTGVVYRNFTETPAAGDRSVAVVRGQYAFSKRTEAYVEVDRSRVDGVTAASFNSATKVGEDRTRSTFSVGIKHTF